MDKNELRRQVRNMKRQFSAGQLSAMSEKACRELTVTPQVRKAQTLLLYYSLDDEVDTHRLIDRLAEAGKSVLLPVVTSDTAMELRQYKSPADLRGGFFNIMEPTGELFSDYEHIDVAVIPGMAFDLQGNRLGRGKGYYDRFLQDKPWLFKIGLCFPFQRFPAIPTDENDVRMDVVIDGH